MKKAIVIPVVLVLFVLGAYLGPLLLAQAPPANVPTGTKVFVVNLRAVLKQNARAKALQAELEETIKPYKLKAASLTKEIDTMKLNAEVLAKKKAEWEALNTQLLSLIEAKHKEKLPVVWTEIGAAIDALAKTHGIQMVLGYSDQKDPDLEMIQSRNNTLTIIDMGSAAMLYHHASIDITPVLIEMLASKNEQGKNLPGNR